MFSLYFIYFISYICCVDRWRIFVVLFFSYLLLFFLYQFNLIKNSYICLRGSEEIKSKTRSDKWLLVISSNSSVHSTTTTVKYIRKISYLYRDDHLVCWLLICDKLNIYKRAKQSLNTHDMNSRFLLFVANSVYATLNLNMKSTNKKMKRYLKRWKNAQKIMTNKKFVKIC